VLSESTQPICELSAELDKGGRSSVVEFQPSKLAVVGSNPIARSKRRREALGVKHEASRKYLGQ
jgi:hypothetical protein